MELFVCWFLLLHVIFSLGKDVVSHSLFGGDRTDVEGVDESGDRGLWNGGVCF